MKRPLRGAVRAPRRPSPPGPQARALQLSHPAMLLATFVAAACAWLSVSFVISDTDFWQHLAVGRAIWRLGHVPTTQLWSWPTYGAPDVNYSWGFEALVAPLWDACGVWGLFAWRWATTLAAFGLLWLVARRMGARGLTPLVLAVLCSLVYRQRSNVRPETLAAVLFALEVWILEGRRHGAKTSTWWLVPIAWVWANCHISYVIGLGYLAVHAGTELLTLHGGRDHGVRRPNAGAHALMLALAAAIAASFLNPFGWRTLTQPFAYLLTWRHEPIYETVGELQSIDWSKNLRNGLPALLALWPAAALWRTRRRGPDLTEWLSWLGFTALAFFSQRFIGLFALACFPYLARDLDEWVRSRRWPAWTAGAWVRGATAIAGCALIGLPEWTWDRQPLGVAVDMSRFPVAACDFMASHGIGGRGFNTFDLAGYLLYRFWPDRSRLPFMDVHQAGTAADRERYMDIQTGPQGWRSADAHYHFDFVLLPRWSVVEGRMLDYLDADSAWRAVSVDDVAALYVRRDGPFAQVAAEYGYVHVPVGRARLNALAPACAADPALRAGLRTELDRMVAASPHHAMAAGLLANLALIERRWPAARAWSKRVLQADARAGAAHECLGIVEMAEGNARAALEDFRTELRRGTPSPYIALRIGSAYWHLGRLDQARAWFERQLRRDPGCQPARDSLAALGVAGGQ